MSDKEKSPHHIRNVWTGIGILALCHLLLFLFPIGFFFISIVQVIYLIPAIIIFHKREGIFQGLLIGAGITVLLNVACFGLFLSGGLNFF